VIAATAWIILIISIILLIAIASPIRLSCKAAYSEESHNTSFSVIAHYINPLILRIEYSSKEDEHIRFFILGFEKKRRDDDVDTKTERDDGIDIDNTSDINTDSVDDHDVNTDSINTSDVNTDSVDDNDINTDSINTNNTDTDGINTDDINVDDTIFDDINTNNNINTADDTDTKNDADAKGKIRSLLSSIKSKINDIKRSRIYKIISKIISNKPLREKLLRWFKRSTVHAIRIASFEKLKIHVKAGTRDPATLGKIYGYFSATKSALAPQNHHIDLTMEPIFMEKRLDIDSELKLKTTLSIILWRLIVITATFPYLRVRKIIKESKTIK
jgi:hypothetical protein